MKRTRLKRGVPLARKGRKLPSKFGNISCTYDGRTFDSRKEAGYAKRLDALRRAQSPKNRVTQWKGQARIPLDVNGSHICDYYCDFLVEFADGRHEWHEVKGFETGEWRLKEKLFRAIYPNEVLRVIR